MLEVVAKRGYRAVTLRELVQVAGVSSRAFYQLYASKEECFLQTHELIASHLVRCIEDAQIGLSGSRKCLRAAIYAFLFELQREPRAGRLLLTDAYVAGSMALRQVRRTEQMLEASITSRFKSKLNGVAAPPRLERGVVVGMMCVARSRLWAADRETALPRLADELTDWAADVYRVFNAEARKNRSPSPLPFDPAELYIPLPTSGSRREAGGDRALIVAATARLAASEGYDELTVSKIRESAGASNSKFTAHFEGVADCFQGAFELYARGAISRLQAGHHFSDQSDLRMGETIGLLCERVAHDATLASLCFMDIFGPGSVGVHSLDRLIDEMADLFFAGKRKHQSRLSTTTEASVAAVWGAMREEIIEKHRSQMPKMVSLLCTFVSASEAEFDEIGNAKAQNLTDPEMTAMLVSSAEQ